MDETREFSTWILIYSTVDKVDIEYILATNDKAKRIMAPYIDFESMNVLKLEDVVNDAQERMTPFLVKCQKLVSFMQSLFYQDEHISSSTFQETHKWLFAYCYYIVYPIFHELITSGCQDKEALQMLDTSPLSINNYLNIMQDVIMPDSKFHETQEMNVYFTLRNVYHPVVYSFMTEHVYKGKKNLISAIEQGHSSETMKLLYFMVMSTKDNAGFTNEDKKSISNIDLSNTLGLWNLLPSSSESDETAYILTFISLMNFMSSFDLTYNDGMSRRQCPIPDVFKGDDKYKYNVFGYKSDASSLLVDSNTGETHAMTTLIRVRKNYGTQARIDKLLYV